MPLCEVVHTPLHVQGDAIQGRINNMGEGESEFKLVGLLKLYANCSNPWFQARSNNEVVKV